MSLPLKKVLTRPAWVAEKAYLWGRSAAALRRDDVIFAFFPKTGSTWVRIVFYHLFNAAASKRALSFDDLDRTMPEFANPSMFQHWPFAGQPRLIKTHYSYMPVFRKNRSVLFAREPRDTMISLLHYLQAVKAFNFSGTLQDLVTHREFGFDYYFRFYQSWQHRAGLVMRYEEMRSAPEHEFARLASFVGLDVDRDDIRAALEASTIKRTREAQIRSTERFKEQFAETFVFARSGRSGEGKESFDSESEATYRERRAAYGFDLYPA